MIVEKDYTRDLKTNLLININKPKLHAHKEKTKLLRDVEILKQELNALKSILMEKGLI